MIYLYLFGTCFHFIYVFMIIGNYFRPDYSGNGPSEGQKIERRKNRICENIE